MRAWVALLVLGGCGDDDPRDIVDAVEAARTAPSGEPQLRALPWRWAREVCVIDTVSEGGTGPRTLRWYDDDARPLLTWDGRYTFWHREFDDDGEVVHVSVRFPWGDAFEEDYEHGRIVARDAPSVGEEWRWDDERLDGYVRWDKSVRGLVDVTYDVDGLPIERLVTGYCDQRTKWRWNPDGTLAREDDRCGTDGGSEVTWTWSEAEGIGTGRWWHNWDGGTGSWTQRWERVDGRLVAYQMDTSDPAIARWSWEGDDVVAYEAGEDRWTWTYDGAGRVVEQTSLFEREVEPDRLETWTWDGDRLSTHRRESMGSWSERRFGARCPPSAWRSDLPDVQEPVMLPWVPVPGEPYE